MKRRLLVPLAIPFFLVGCSKSTDNPTPSTALKEYQVLYQVSTVKYTQANIIYRDENGTLITETNVTLPKTYTFKRTMKSPDVVSCGAFPSGGDASYSVSSTISLDGTVVNTVSGVGPAPQTVASYIIP